MSGRLEKNEVDMLTVNKQRLEELVLVQKSLIELNRQNARSYFDQVISVQQMQAGAKGYLTRLEAVNQTGLSVYMTYENQLRTLDDQSRAIDLQLEGQKELKLNVQQQLDTAQDLTEEERQQYQNTLNGIIAEGTRLGQHKTKLGLLARELKLSQSIASTNAMERDAFQRDLKAYQTYLGAMVEIAREGNGVWDKFFSVAPIIEAKAAMVEIERQAFYEGRDAGLEGDRLTEFIKMKKKLADIRLEKSYAEAIPYTREFLDGLRASVTEGGNLNEVFKSVLQRINDISYDISATILTGWVNKNMGSMLGIGKTSVPAFEQTQGTLSVGNTATTGAANPVASGATVAGGALTQLATAAEGGAQSLTSDFTTAIVDSSAGHLGAMAEFVTSLQIARNAVINFAQSLPGAATVSGGNGGNILGTLVKGAVGALSGGIGGFTAGNAAAGLSTANAVASGSFGGFASLPMFKYGGVVEKLSNVQTFKEGGEVKEIATYKDGGMVKKLSAFIPTFKYGGDVEKLTDVQTFKEGGMVEKLFSVPTFANGGKVDPLRTAIASAFKKEGRGAMLAVMHSGEHVLSDRQGEAQSYRVLEKHFGKNPLGKIPLPTFKYGGVVEKLSNVQTFKEGGEVKEIATYKDGGMVKKLSTFIPMYRDSGKIPMPTFMNGGPVGSVEARLLSGLNSTRMPSLSLPTENRRSPVTAGPVSNTVNVNINDRESRFYKQSRTLARELADELRG